MTIRPLTIIFGLYLLAAPVSNSQTVLGAAIPQSQLGRLNDAAPAKAA